MFIFRNIEKVNRIYGVNTRSDCVNEGSSKCVERGAFTGCVISRACMKEIKSLLRNFSKKDSLILLLVCQNKNVNLQHFVQLLQLLATYDF